MPEHLQLTLKQADWAIEASESTQKKKKNHRGWQGEIRQGVPQSVKFQGHM